MPDTFIDEKANVTWTNHHENVAVPVSRLLTIRNENPGNATLAGLGQTAARIQGIIARALAAGVRLRTVGSRWSFSDIPVSQNGWQLETSQIDYGFKVPFSALETGTRFLQEELFIFQCGAKISTINEKIEDGSLKRALRTSGASNGQTIGGALGTGVHGSAIDIGGLESQVAGLQILTANRNLWVEPASKPALNAAHVAKFGATLVRNDDLFAAALVSLGALGVIHAVLLVSTGRYVLNSSLSHIPIGTIANAMNTLDFAGSGIPDQTRRPYFFQTILDPHRADIAYTTVRYKEPFPASKVIDYNLVSGSEPGTNLPRMIGSAITMFPDLRNTAVSELMKIELRVRADVPAEFTTPGETYTFTNAREGVASSGFAIPIGQTSNAIAIARAAFMEHKSAPVVFTCRYAQKSPALLGFTRFAPTCIMDIDGIDTPATQRLLNLVPQRFDAAGMPYAMHWGKTNSMTKTRVRSAFGGAVDKWNAARRLLFADPAERKLFSTPFLDGLGLNA